MYGSEVVLFMIFLRLVIPVGLLFWAGEAARRRNPAEYRRVSRQA